MLTFDVVAKMSVTVYAGRSSLGNTQSTMSKVARSIGESDQFWLSENSRLVLSIIASFPQYVLLSFQVFTMHAALRLNYIIYVIFHHVLCRGSLEYDPGQIIGHTTLASCKDMPNIP
jgi:hypothetical protein